MLVKKRKIPKNSGQQKKSGSEKNQKSRSWHEKQILPIVKLEKGPKKASTPTYEFHAQKNALSERHFDQMLRFYVRVNFSC